jgi:nitroimidazol reductase NimA-like FMN-containing flavoprotein (pyridoxamine 5'-phosphate oxidase superfamily)
MIGRLNDEQIEELLNSNNIGRIGCRDYEQVYIVPINYIYDGSSIIAHSVAGMKIEMMRKHPEVCFQVDQIKDGNNWKSVVAWGQYKELTEERERYEAMKLFVERTLRLKISETAIPPELSDHRVHPRSPGNIKPVIYRILLEKKTGRYEHL